MKSQKVFLGAEPNLKALLARLANNDEKLVSSFSQLIIRLALKPNEDASYEIPQVIRFKSNYRSHNHLAYFTHSSYVSRH